MPTARGSGVLVWCFVILKAGKCTAIIYKQARLESATILSVVVTEVCASLQFVASSSWVYDTGVKMQSIKCPNHWKWQMHICTMDTIQQGSVHRHQMWHPSNFSWKILT